MRVFVTGAAGFLGSHICDQFEDVVGVDNLVGGEEENVPAHVEFYADDCRDEMFDLMRGCDVVYHTACYPHEGFSVFAPRIITQSVFDVSANVFSTAIQAGVKRIVFCSSMSRYGSQAPPFTEDMRPAPQDPYAIAKVASEQLLANLAEVHDIEHVIAIPHNIVGRRQKYDDPYRNVAAIMVNRVMSGKPPIIYGDGTQTRCFSHIDDVIQCMRKLVECPSGTVVNVGPDEGAVTINELAETVMDVVGVSFEPLYYSDRPQEVRHATCSSDKARELLGYETRHTLKDAIHDIARHIESRGARDFTYHLQLEIENCRTPVTWRDRLF